MKDLAFHLTDIVENGIRAGAGEIGIRLRCVGREFRMRIDDNGCGMDAETLERAVNPFFTTRTTRKMGLGLPFLFQNAEQCGGSAGVRSRPDGARWSKHAFRSTTSTVRLRATWPGHSCSLSSATPG